MKKRHGFKQSNIEEELNGNKVRVWVLQTPTSDVSPKT